jgi:DNA-binding response OmpR family regulator
MYVLLIEDDLDIRSAIAALLRRKNYQVEEVSTAKAAIDKIQSIRFDVVIADQRLPGKATGLEVLAHHNQVSREGVRILLTGFFSDELTTVCREIDALYVQKPIPPSQLVAKIEKLVHRSSSNG